MSSRSLQLLSVPGLRPRGYRFGPFELEIRSGELRKNGVRIRLRKQSLEILVMLLEHPGEVVLREEIRRKLWPGDTVVEFDHSINTAIQRLRDALLDSAEEARYIETLPGRGYRFIGTVERLDPKPVLAAAGMPQASLEARIGNAGPASKKLVFLLAALAAVLCGVAVAGWMRPVRREALPNWVLPLGPMADAAVSPDGSAVLYRRAGALFLRRMDSETEIEVYSASRLVDRPIWSPDGSQALFQTMAGLIRTPVPHGPAVTIWPDRRVTRGYSWGSDGEILVAAMDFDGTNSLYLIPPGNESPRRLEIPQLKNGIFYEPEFLPQRGEFLFTWALDGENEAGIYLATLKERRVVNGPLLLRRNVTAGHFARAGGGQLLYVQDNNLYAQALDLRRGALTGGPTRVVEDVYSVLEARHAFFGVSRNGVLAWRPGKAGTTRLTWFDRAGRVLGTAGPPGDPSAVFLSPDETHLLLTIGDHFGGILDAHHSAYTKLAGTVRGVWTRDSKYILYSPRGSGRILERDLASGSDQEVARVPVVGSLRALSPDGKVLLYAADRKLYSIRLDGPFAVPAVVLGEHCTHAGFSPDGKWLVYSTLVPTVDRAEVFVKPLAFEGLSKQISVDGGSAPVWRGDGREILYVNGSKIYGVRVRPDGTQISASAPELLFEVRPPAGLTGDSVPLAVTHDGSRILFTQASEGADSKMTYIMSAWERALTP